MERIRQQIMKKEIKEKDFRIQKFKAEREREILDCRAQAYYTAELREQLRYFKYNFMFIINIVIKNGFFFLFFLEER